MQCCFQDSFTIFAQHYPIWIFSIKVYVNFFSPALRQQSAPFPVTNTKPILYHQTQNDITIYSQKPLWAEHCVTSLNMLHLQNIPVFINIAHVFHAFIKLLPKHSLFKGHGKLSNVEGMSVNQREKSSLLSNLAICPVTWQLVFIGVTIINQHN